MRARRPLRGRASPGARQAGRAGGPSGAGPRPRHAGQRAARPLRGQLSGIGGVLRPGIVHRLDKDASGLMVVAKDDRAHVGLAAPVQRPSDRARLHAIVWGRAAAAAPASIERPIGRHPERSQAHGGGRGRQAGADPLPARGGRRRRSPRRLRSSSRPDAPTRSGSISARSASASSAIRSTGPRRRSPSARRWPQHLAGFRRIALHADRLGFEHPITGEQLRFERAGAGRLRAAVRVLCAAGARFSHC